MISKKYKKTCMALNYIEHLLILASAVTGCVSISAFATVVGIAIASLNTMEVLISKSLIDSYISRNEKDEENKNPKAAKSKKEE